ncbi:hypothetical protein NVS47_16990 [Dehalobacterium formicoaceticum]|uniref:UmuC domain-containing protein n=1 Tax=Dehalobacterium formicoaceticum TaxID=51515 RepID=A0ABT1Y8H0_9FIRM|nr:hypothetical protein [Dehalobacterium formicoaceticum]MCR6547184.1 hypothetical protein [Dehalobacterium formicoaceticum]
MSKDRALLHSDLNSFYASVEIMLNPTLRDKAIAVCGSTEDRHDNFFSLLAHFSPRGEKNQESG